MKKDSPSSWIEKNIETMMGQVAEDARYARPRPVYITFNPIAYSKFVEILKSQSAFFPDKNGDISFLTVPVHINQRLPYGTFVVERFKDLGRTLTAK